MNELTFKGYLREAFESEYNGEEENKEESWEDWLYELDIEHVIEMAENWYKWIK